MITELLTKPRPAELRTRFWVLSLVHYAACLLRTPAGVSDGVRLHKWPYAQFRGTTFRASTRVYSITSSARARTAAGILRPRAFAVC